MQEIVDFVKIFACLIALVFVLVQVQQPAAKKGAWLPSVDNAAKREYEVWALRYSVVWMGIFGVVVVTKAYKSFDADGYMYLCCGLALPLLLQPLFFPLPAEKNLPLFLRYSFKANVWIAGFSFIGNYWYTHYFYSVLKATYTMPSHRLNNVPIALYFATHFYFTSYHTFSNLILRKVETSFAPTTLRSLLFWAVVVTFSYFTAFMESFTISSYEYYSFSVPKALIYSLGSFFYGIYFLVSFPVFYRLDEKVSLKEKVAPHTLFQTVFEVLGSGMLVLLLLDFCRIGLGVPLNVPGSFFCVSEVGKQCVFKSGGGR